MSFDELIPKLVKFPEAHAKFINTLSFLEYIGARKILKSQQSEYVSSQILAHIAEEVRHAQVLKKVALKMTEGRLDSYSFDHLLCGDEASRYIQTIDYSVEKELKIKNSWTNYLYTTLFIEERANLVYPVYEAYLAEIGFPGVLKAIIREEDNHLQDITEQLKNAGSLTGQSLAYLREIETQAFGRFIEKISLKLPFGS